jgi:hypothetical protein
MVKVTMVSEQRLEQPLLVWLTHLTVTTINSISAGEQENIFRPHLFKPVTP